jgi:hypothetical protein
MATTAGAVTPTRSRDSARGLQSKRRLARSSGPDARETLLADIAAAEAAGDRMLADELREVGYAGGHLKRPTGSELLNLEIRRAAGGG